MCNDEQLRQHPISVYWRPLNRSFMIISLHIASLISVKIVPYHHMYQWLKWIDHFSVNQEESVYNKFKLVLSMICWCDKDFSSFVLKKKIEAKCIIKTHSHFKKEIIFTTILPGKLFFCQPSYSRG